MRRALLLIPIFSSTLAISCTPIQRGTGTGAVAGAAIGSIIADGDNHTKGALIGGGIGAAAGATISKHQERRDKASSSTPSSATSSTYYY